MLYKNTNTVDLSLYNNAWYNTGASVIKRTLWYFANSAILNNSFIPFSRIKIKVLRLFGAKIGKGVVIKPSVNIKYPWNLKIGDYVWIGENVWIDNLVKVHIGKKAVVSQGALLLCGNHNYKKPTFDLMVKEIDIQEGAWIGANCTVCQGVTAKPYSMLAVGSVASHDLDAYGLYRGNPAVKVKERVIFH